ncbi:MAG: hypothetical protein H0X13_14135, partial [Ramlibacter sp.]|nr:hypothetical protein [Ramlibacter sp.]
CFASGSGWFDQLVYHHRFGLAYAGSSLLALNVNAALSSCLSRLNTFSNPPGPPSLEDIAKFAHKLLGLYTSQYAVVGGPTARCEVALSGCCPITRELEIFHLSPMVTGYELTRYRASDQCNEFVLLLGTDKNGISDEIANRRSESRDRDISWWRTPQTVVASVIATGTHPTIGGHMQLGICSSVGFEIYSIIKSENAESLSAHFSYLGMDVTGEFACVGATRVAMPGMCCDVSNTDPG